MEVSGLWGQSSLDSLDGNSSAHDLWTPPLTENAQFLQGGYAPKDNVDEIQCPASNPYGTGAQGPRLASVPASVVVQNEGEKAGVVTSAFDIKALIPSKSNGQLSKGAAMGSTDETPGAQPAPSSPRSIDARDNGVDGSLQGPAKRPQSGDIFSTLEAELAEIERRYIEPAPSTSKPSPARTRRTSLASSWASSSGGGSAFNPLAWPSNPHPPASPVAATAPSAPTMLEFLLSSSGEPPPRSRTGSQAGSQAFVHGTSLQAPQQSEPTRPLNGPQVGVPTAPAAVGQEGLALPSGDNDTSRQQGPMGGSNGAQKGNIAAPRQPAHARTYVSGIPSYSPAASAVQNQKRAPLNAAGVPAPQLEPWPLLPPPQTTTNVVDAPKIASQAPEQSTNVNPPSSPVDARVGAMASALSMRLQAAAVATPPPATSAVEMVQAQLLSSGSPSPRTDEDMRGNGDGDGHGVRSVATWGGATGGVGYGVAQQKVLASLGCNDDGPLKVGKRSASASGFTEALAASAKGSSSTSLATQTLAAVEAMTRAAAALNATAGAPPKTSDPSTSAQAPRARSVPREGTAATAVPAAAAARARQQPTMPQTGAKTSLLVLLEAITNEATLRKPASAALSTVTESPSASEPPAAPEPAPASQTSAALEPVAVAPEPASQPAAAPEPTPASELPAPTEPSPALQPTTATEPSMDPPSSAAAESQPAYQPPKAAEPLAAWQPPVAVELSSASLLSSTTESSQASQVQSEPQLPEASTVGTSVSDTPCSSSEQPEAADLPPADTTKFFMHPTSQAAASAPGCRRPSGDSSDAPNLDSASVDLDSLIATDTPFSGSKAQGSWIPDLTLCSDSSISSASSDAGPLQTVEGTSHSRASADSENRPGHLDAPPSAASVADGSEGASTADKHPPEGATTQTADASQVVTRTNSHTSGGRISTSSGESLGGLVAPVFRESVEAPGQLLTRSPMQPSLESQHFSAFLQRLFEQGSRTSGQVGEQASELGPEPGRVAEGSEEEGVRSPVLVAQQVLAADVLSGLQRLESTESTEQSEVSATALEMGEGQEQPQSQSESGGRPPSIDLSVPEPQQVRGEKRQAEKLTDPGCRPAPVRRAVRSGRRYDVGRGLDIGGTGNGFMKATTGEPELKPVLGHPDNTAAATAMVLAPAVDAKEPGDEGVEGRQSNDGGSSADPEQPPTQPGSLPVQRGNSGSTLPESQGPHVGAILPQQPATEAEPIERSTREVGCLAEEVAPQQAGRSEAERRLEEAATRAEAAALALLAAVELRVQIEEDAEEQDEDAWQLHLERRLGHLDLQTSKSTPSVARGVGQGPSSLSEELLRAARQAALEALQARVLDVQSRYNARRLRRRAARANGEALGSPRGAATLPGALSSRSTNTAGRYRPNSAALHHKSPRSPTRQRPFSNLSTKPAPLTSIPSASRPDANRADAPNNTDSSQPSKGLRQILAQLASPTSIGKKPAASDGGIPALAPTTHDHKQSGAAATSRNLGAAPSPSIALRSSAALPSHPLPRRKSIAPLVLPTTARAGSTINPRHSVPSVSLQPTGSMHPSLTPAGLLMSWLSSPSPVTTAPTSENIPPAHAHTGGPPEQRPRCHDADRTTRRLTLRLVSAAGPGKPSHPNSLPGSSAFAPPASDPWAPRGGPAQEGAPWQRCGGAAGTPVQAAQPRWTPKAASLMLSSSARYVRPQQQQLRPPPHSSSAAHRTYTVAPKAGEAPTRPMMPHFAALSSTAWPSPAASPMLAGSSQSGRGRALGPDVDGIHSSARSPRFSMPLPSLPGEANELRSLCALARDLPQLDPMQRVQLWERLEQLLAQKLARSPRSRSATAGGRTLGTDVGDRTSQQQPRRRISPRSNSPLRGYSAVWEWRQRNSSCGSASGSRWSASGGTVDESCGGSGSLSARDVAGGERAQSFLLQLLLNPADVAERSARNGDELLDSTLDAVHRVIAPNATLAHAMSLNWQSAKSQATKLGTLGGWERGLL